MEEIWSPIRGYDGKPVISRNGIRYEASTFGRARSTNRHGKVLILKQNRSADGYYRLHIQDEYGRVTFLTHQAVLQAFHGLPPDGFACLHVNGDRTDNRLCNLRYEPRSKVYGHARRVVLTCRRGTPCEQYYSSCLAADRHLGLKRGDANKSAREGRAVKGYLFEFA